jgi:hypothetical protein
VIANESIFSISFFGIVVSPSFFSFSSLPDTLRVTIFEMDHPWDVPYVLLEENVGGLQEEPQGTRVNLLL